MALVTDENNIFGLVTFRTWAGQYSGSWGSQDFASSFADSTVTYRPTSQQVTFNTHNNLTHGFNTYYKMQGYNNATAKYEVWFSTGTPLLIPPSGNPLSNIEVVTSWIDR